MLLSSSSVSLRCVAAAASRKASTRVDYDQTITFVSASEGDTRRQRSSRGPDSGESETHANDRRRDLRLRKDPSGSDLRATQISGGVPRTLGLAAAYLGHRDATVLGNLFDSVRHVHECDDQLGFSASGSNKVEAYASLVLCNASSSAGFPSPTNLAKFGSVFARFVESCSRHGRAM